MRKVTNIITGFIFALAPIAGAVVIGVAIYDSIPNTIGLIILVALLALSVWAGIKIFKLNQIIGPMELLTAVHASPDLDNLEPTSNSATKTRQPEELVELNRTGKNIFTGGSIRIYGNWFGNAYALNHEIVSIDFQNNHLLIIDFRTGEKLEILNPNHIFEAPTFLRIVDADCVKLTLLNLDHEKKSYFLQHKKEGKKIITSTNMDMKNAAINVSLSEPALMIYGRIN